MPTLSTLFYIYLTLAIAGVSFSFISHFLGGADGADGHMDADHFDGEHHGFTFSKIFSLRNLIAFIAGFGGAGMIAIQAGYDAWASIGFAILGGVVLATLGYLFFKTIAKQQGNSATNLSNLVGKEASVVIGIPEGGRGEIQAFNEFGSVVTLPAQSQGGPVKTGATVKVLAVVGGVATV